MHYFAKTMEELIDVFGVDKSIDILDVSLTDKHGGTLLVHEVDDIIRSKYLSNQRGVEE